MFVNKTMQNYQIDEKKSAGWLKDILALLLLFSVIYLGFSWMRPLASPDEGRYSEIPMEMVRSGDYITPTLNDMPYFYKPPLFYWFQCGAIKMFGVNKFSLRFANSLMALLGIVITYCAGRSLYGRTAGIMSALCLAMGVFYFALGQIITLDMTVSVFIAGAMFSFIIALKKSGVWRGILILCFFAMSALAVMSKGIIGILIPCATIFIYALSLGIFSFLRKLKLSDLWWIIAGIILFLAIASPWHILATSANPPYENASGLFSKSALGQGFFWYYFVHEHFLRFIDPATSMRAEPWWYFLVLAPIGFFPCLIFLPQTLKDISKKGWGNLRSENSEILYFLIWTIFVVGFFSVSSSKLATYILPIYPALSVVVGVWLAKIWDEKNFIRLKIPQNIMICLGYIAVIVPWIIWHILNSKGKLLEQSDDMVLPVAILSLLMLTGTSIAHFFAKNGDVKKFWIIAIATMCALFVMFSALAGFLQRESTEGLVEKIADVRTKDDAFVIAYEYNIFQDFPVWLGQTVYTIGDVPEEQTFGYMRSGNANASRFIKDNIGFRTLIKKTKGNIYVIIHNRDIDDFNKEFCADYSVVAKERNFNLLKIKK